jgi:hypothetical protein
VVCIRVNFIAIRCRSLRIAPFGALLCELGRRHRKSGCVVSLRCPLFERMGGERPIHSD